MASLYICDVPDETLRTLKARAAIAGQSLEAYARGPLVSEASALSLEEAVGRARDIGARNAVTDGDILDALAEARSTRSA